MTTHSPYPQQPPAPAYPTAPPWAAPPASPPAGPPPAYGAPGPYGAPYPQHGGLLVPYPEEMVNAARPRPPAWWPVVAWTFFFGPLGVVSASRRAGQARRGRNSVAPYWVAWSVTLAVSAVAAMVVFAAGVPAYLAYRESVVTEVVQEKILGDGKLRSASGAVTSAVCEPIGPRDRDGIRLYECLLTTENGRTGSLTVTADADGNWTAAKK